MRRSSFWTMWTKKTLVRHPELRVFDAHELDAALDYLKLLGPDSAGACATSKSLRKNVILDGETRSLR
jgi:hypothetical protein